MTLYPPVKKKKTAVADILLLDKHAALFTDNTQCHLLAKASGRISPGFSSNQQPPSQKLTAAGVCHSGQCTHKTVFQQVDSI